MSLFQEPPPWNETFWFRYIVRSKDRISGTPNSFVVQLPNPLPDNATDVWLQVLNVGIDTFPNPSDTSTVNTLEGNSGNYNQPNTPSLVYDDYGFDTGCGVDVCLSGNGTLNTIDTETITASPVYYTSTSTTSGSGTSITLPIYNKVGICVSGSGYSGVGDTATCAGITGTMTVSGFSTNGVTFTIASQTWGTIPVNTPVYFTPAQPAKSRADKTLCFIPYNRSESERTLRLAVPQPWVKLNPTNFSTLTFKLFSDRGYPLKIKRLYAGTNVTDMNDYNIDDWYIDFVVAVRDHLPKGASQHKI